MAGRVLVVQLRAISDGHDAGRRVNGKTSIGTVGQRIGRSITRVEVAARNRTHNCTVGSIFGRVHAAGSQVKRRVVRALNRDGDLSRTGKAASILNRVGEDIDECICCGAQSFDRRIRVINVVEVRTVGSYRD